MTPAEQYQKEAEELYPIKWTGPEGLSPDEIFSIAIHDRKAFACRAAYIAGRTKSDWVSVEERLPEAAKNGGATEVIACYLHNTELTYQSISSAFFNGVFYVLATWSEDGTQSDQIKALYWQPLPEPPKP